MSESELSPRKTEREHQIITHIFERAFPGAKMEVKEGKNYFAVKIEDYYFKVEVKEVGRKSA